MNIQNMTRSDVATFDKEKSTTLSPNASGFVTAGAMTINTRDHLTRTGV